MRRIDVQRKDSVSSGYLRTFRNSFSSAVPCRRRTSGTVHGSDDRSENRSGRHRNALPGAGVKIVAFWGRYGCFTTKERQFFVLLKMLLGGSAVVAVLDGSARGGLNPELLWVMLDGQRLFNRLGEELLVLAGGEDACGTKDVTGRALDASRRARLAADLELWFERYRVQWLSIGRYAELARIAHVVWSFADILRRGAL